MAKTNPETPLMKQHRAIKQKYPDAILLFRVGDFYETFGQDAVITAQVLGITLAKRNNGIDQSNELAGFPYHALDTYLHKLVKAGYRVAICDQLENPKEAKGIVKRGVTELVTPGIATNDKLLEHNSNNFLAAIHFSAEKMGVAFTDISTGEFFVAEGNVEYIEKLFQALQPAEVIFQRSWLKRFKEQFGVKFYTYTLEAWIFEKAFATETLLRHFQTLSLKGYGIDGMEEGIIAAGAVLYYLKETEHPHLQHINTIQRIERDDYLWMDRFTIRNLEILGSSDSSRNEESQTLLKVLDNTVSPMGARMLKRWAVLPLKDLFKINERLEMVSFLILSPDIRQQFQQGLKHSGDMERLIGKVPNKRINPREIWQLAKGLEQMAIIKQMGAQSGNKYLERLSDSINPCTFILDKIRKELVDSPPLASTKGGVIKSGIHERLDDLRNVSSKGKEFLLEIQQKESENTGISSLKVHFNNVFGYYLEVTNIHKKKVPKEWIRKQTLANAERYITPELKEYEEKILGAEENIIAIETILYEQLVVSLQDFISPIQANAHIAATLDCLLSFATNAIKYNYKKPELHNGLMLELKGSRHPVIERCLPPGESYIANDITIDPAEQQIIIVTGPNMSGKSAVLRQTALITLMAHIGSFVPADSAHIPLTDKIFTRVGASDNLSGGESTFMVEMNETASILNNISARSLVILDEIGRGTSTYDGISIAWSIVEFLQASPHAPKTLFATHYHELNEIENILPRIKNYHITHKEINNKIIFLRKLCMGGSTHSFGIHVARMAGMPPSLIDRANAILKQLEEKNVRNERDGDENQSQAKPSTGIKTTDLATKVKKIQVPQVQLSIFDAHSQTFNDIRTTLEKIDINRLTPVEALMKLFEIKGMLK